MTTKDYRSERQFEEIWESWRYLFKHETLGLTRQDIQASEEKGSRVLNLNDWRGDGG